MMVEFGENSRLDEFTFELLLVQGSWILHFGLWF